METELLEGCTSCELRREVVYSFSLFYNPNPSEGSIYILVPLLSGQLEWQKLNTYQEQHFSLSSGNFPLDLFSYSKPMGSSSGLGKWEKLPFYCDMNWRLSEAFFSGKKKKKIPDLEKQNAFVSKVCFIPCQSESKNWKLLFFSLLYFCNNHSTTF